MKEVHLICNAHIDPIWQWEWEEGAATALSTFRSAVDLASEFDYIFCHNEVTLYKYIEQYAPSLFAEIKKLVRAGKWHIMGGWYLQPDCNMPQGESFVRQIQLGHRYFIEKFGVKPTTAINFDPFGHSSGLPQIISGCGQDSYILMRAGDDPLPSRQFVWEGVDGSRIKVYATPHGYNSPLGKAATIIRERAEELEGDVVCILWGVGNHGGGPSRKDLADIKAMQEELGDKMTILHSTPEQFFASIDPEVVHQGALRISMPGCYTSMVRIKQKHAELENSLYMTEKICTVAAMRGLIEYPEKELDEATEDLLNAEFHDVLPGSSIRAGEENGLQFLDHGLLLLNRLRASAFFAMSKTQPRAKEGEYPILVFNPQPYTWESEMICEMMLADQNYSEEISSHLHIYDENGTELPLQIIKEESNINLDWRKRLIFRASIKPLDITRFSVYVDFEPAKEKSKLPKGEDLIFDADVEHNGHKVHKHVEIDGKSGRMRSYRIGEKEYISSKEYFGACGAFLPVFYEDTPDPWGMQKFQLSEMGTDPRPFMLSEKPCGVFKGMSSVQVIEDGVIYTGIECFFELDNTKIRVEYDIYKTNVAVDIKVDAFMADADKMLKLSVPLMPTGEIIGQTAFGTEVLYNNGRENVAQRFLAIREGEGECVALLNRGTYGSSYKDGVLSMSLIRGATYCAHPIGDRQIIPGDRFIKKIDMGERNFAFRLTLAREESLERAAQEFNVTPYACNVFPAEAELAPNVNFEAVSLNISDRDIVLVTAKKQFGEDAYIFRLLNNRASDCDCTFELNGAMIELHFGRYEVKTVRVSDGKATEEKSLLV